MKVVIYARVSTLAQEYDRQIDELKDYAKRMNYQVVKVFSEKISINPVETDKNKRENANKICCIIVNFP